MADLIPYETTLRITDLTLNPQHINVVHNIETGGRKVYTLAAGHWVGAVTFGARADPKEAAKVETFLTAIASEIDYTDLPLAGKLTGGTASIVTGIDSGGFRFSENTNFQDKAGYLWTVNNRLFRQLNNQPPYTFFPFVEWQTGQIIQPATSIRIVQTGDVNLVSTPHWSGTWTVQFSEYLQ